MLRRISPLGGKRRVLLGPTFSLPAGRLLALMRPYHDADSPCPIRTKATGGTPSLSLKHQCRQSSQGPCYPSLQVVEIRISQTVWRSPPVEKLVSWTPSSRLTFENLEALKADVLQTETAKIALLREAHLTIISVTTVTRGRNRVQIRKTRKRGSDDLIV
jgi:hypothetical protein